MRSKWVDLQKLLTNGIIELSTIYANIRAIYIQSNFTIQQRTKKEILLGYVCKIYLYIKTKSYKEQTLYFSPINETEEHTIF